MNTYVTGAAVKELREVRKMTQAELAEKIGVSSKTVSKWETGKGLPDISLLQPLAQALGISVIELIDLTGFECSAESGFIVFTNSYGIV